eukprot:scaffold88696_cov29-Tisochrysis_lutea.AAC.1
MSYGCVSHRKCCVYSANTSACGARQRSVDAPRCSDILHLQQTNRVISHTALYSSSSLGAGSRGGFNMADKLAMVKKPLNATVSVPKTALSMWMSDPYQTGPAIAALVYERKTGGGGIRSRQSDGGSGQSRAVVVHCGRKSTARAASGEANVQGREAGKESDERGRKGTGEGRGGRERRERRAAPHHTTDSCRCPQGFRYRLGRTTQPRH